ncbi:MAG: threonine--tRNA ligase, partial [Actinobacteria bacterium HGW-Actinobacteria-8]
MQGVDVASISVTVDGDERILEAGTTGADLFGDRRDVVVMRVAGELCDLAREIRADDVVEPVLVSEPDGLNVLRHSATHVMAQAVQGLRPGAKLGIGPFITDGFYYDFDVEEPFTPEDLKALEKAMQRIVKEGQTFRRRTVTQEEALAELADQPYKCQLLNRAAGVDGAEGVSVEVGAGETTIYDNLNRQGETVWKDLCRGPHVPSTKVLANGWSLMRSAAAYWLGSEKNPQLQRIYGTAWPTKDELVAYKDRLAEAERRDHRRL